MTVTELVVKIGADLSDFNGNLNTGIDKLGDRTKYGSLLCITAK